MIQTSQIFDLCNEIEKHVSVGPISHRPIYKLSDTRNSDKHKIVAGVCERTQLRAPYDSEIVKDVIYQSKRFNRLKPQILFGILASHRNSRFIKKLAISRLEEDLRKQVNAFSKMNECKNEINIPSDELSHSIFSWKWIDFLTRRKLKNFVWVDVLFKSTENSLHIYKFQKDLEQLQMFLEKIFDGLFSNMEDELIDVYRHVEKNIVEAKKALHTTDSAEDDLCSNTKELRHLIHKKHFLNDPKRDSEEKFLKIHLENRIFNTHIWDPVEVRFQLNWFNNLVQQHLYSLNRDIENCQTVVGKYFNLIKLEGFIDGNIMDFCYTSTEIYKTRIDILQDKFDKDLEIMDNKLIIARIQIDRLKEERQFLFDEIERYHKEEEQIRLEKERKKDEERLEREREAEKIAAQEALKKDMQKHKRKNKKKN